jgi:hypothetical protein
VLSMLYQADEAMNRSFLREPSKYGCQVRTMEAEPRKH